VEIWLLRHAMAEDRAASGRDADRTLTSDGKARAEAVAKGLAKLDPGIAAVITSPYKRARQTAEPAARELNLASRIRESEALEPSADPERILEELDAEELPSVLLVGHQPHLGALLGRLVGGSGLEIPLKKAAVARIELSGRRSGELRALLPARVLEKLG
jgi:phosphohistidine phosphatase